MIATNVSNQETLKIDQVRQLYMRRRVLHCCAHGDLLRAPDDSEARKGGEVVLESVTTDKAGNVLSGVVLVGESEAREIWYPWPEGHISTRRRVRSGQSVDETDDEIEAQSADQPRGPALARAQHRPPTRARRARA